MRAPDFNIDLLIQNLQGTCNTLDEVVSDLYPGMDETDLTEDDHSIIDNEIFLCDTCNWWCEICESCNEYEDCGGVNCESCCEEQHDN